MRFSPSRILLAVSLVLPMSLHAATPVAESSSSMNPLLVMLVSLAIVFLFAIAVLAYVLKQLASANIEKLRKERASGTIKSLLFLVALLLIPSLNALAQAAAPTATAATASASPLIGGVDAMDIYMIIGFLAFELLVMLALIFQIMSLVKALRSLPEKTAAYGTSTKKSLMDVFNNSVSIEKEKDILLDHDYDGIQELDNDLPPWWKYGFIVTIIVAFLYLGYYWGFGGPTQAEEFEQSVAKAKVEQDAFLAKAGNNVDENSVKPVTDAAAMATAKATFETTCAACHLKDGGGSVGPNLTDDYWIHSGGLKDIFKTIKYGWPDKGMKSWKDDYSASQIAALATYVKSLRGTHPLTPKAPQGDLYSEGGGGTTTKPADSTAAPKADTTKKTAIK